MTGFDLCLQGQRSLKISRFLWSSSKHLMIYMKQNEGHMRCFHIGQSGVNWLGSFSYCRFFQWAKLPGRLLVCFRFFWYVPTSSPQFCFVCSTHWRHLWSSVNVKAPPTSSPSQTERHFWGDTRGRRFPPTVSDGVRGLQLLVGAGLANPQGWGVGHAPVRDRWATVLGLQQVEVVGHGGRVAHQARVHGEAVLVARPRQLGDERREFRTFFSGCTDTLKLISL